MMEPMDRKPDEPTYLYRKRLHPEYKGNRKRNRQARERKLEQRRAEREWQRILDRV